MLGLAPLQPVRPVAKCLATLPGLQIFQFCNSLNLHNAAQAGAVHQRVPYPAAKQAATATAAKVAAAAADHSVRHLQYAWQPSAACRLSQKRIPGLCIPIGQSSCLSTIPCRPSITLPLSWTPLCETLCQRQVSLHTVYAQYEYCSIQQ